MWPNSLKLIWTTMKTAVVLTSCELISSWKFDETLTVREMRAKLRQTGAIGETEKPTLVPLTHYLLFRFDEDWRALVNAPQGKPEEVAEAQKRLEAVQAALAEAQEKAANARESAAEALNRENVAKQREQEALDAEERAKAREEEAAASAETARQREAEASAAAEEARAREAEQKAAQAELEAALAELKAQEEAYAAKTQELKTKSEGAGVAPLRAKNELAQHLSEDPLPLRRAKISQEAALKKAERLRAPFEAATKEA